MTPRSAADLIHGRAAARQYRQWADRLQARANELQIDPESGAGKVWAWWVDRVRRAALAEETDPE